MMAAASPRLRPLLRALRAQELRAPLWARCHNGRRGLGTQATAVPPTSPTEQQSPLMGQESPLMGQEAPLVGQQSPLMGQNPLVGQEGLHLEPQLALMGRQDPVAAPPSPLVGQPHGCVGPEEVRLEDLGLGAMSPVGLVQNLLQFLHLDVGLPWWGAIAAAARAYAELAAYQRRHNVNPLRGFLVPIVQTPIFVSFFMALQQMAAAPLPGLKGGGAAWISDLSCPDPTYALPLLTSATMWMVLEAGAGSAGGHAHFPAKPRPPAGSHAQMPQTTPPM
eukprot:XP_025002130.1 mitochondrial inner membrane protein OXA1L-like isoform X2 [Gallus gallus]